MQIISKFKKQSKDCFNIFLDYSRSPQDITYLPYNSIYYTENFVITRSYKEFTEAVLENIDKGLFLNNVSLNHDLIENKFKVNDKYNFENYDSFTGYHCLTALFNLAIENKLIIKRNSINIHSMNSKGIDNMVELIRKHYGESLSRVTPIDKRIRYV